MGTCILSTTHLLMVPELFGTYRKHNVLYISCSTTHPQEKKISKRFWSRICCHYLSARFEGLKTSRSVRNMAQRWSYRRSTEDPPAPKRLKKTYHLVKSTTIGKFFPVKLTFFITIAKEFETYLTAYQADDSVLTFMGPDLKALLKSLMHRMIKPEPS